MPIVLDLEATCSDDDSIPRREMEIIEIGAVAVVDGVVVDEFCEFIQPVRHPRLTEFCTRLTSITQLDVDHADGFEAVSRRFAQFASAYARQSDGSQWWGSWGAYDFNQLAQDVEFHRGIKPLTAPHRNLKEEFTQRQGLRKRPGLDDAITLAGLTFTGTHHRGIDDARNITRLLPWIDGDSEVTARSIQDWQRARAARRP